MSLTNRQIQSRLSKLYSMADLRIGGFLWQSSSDLGVSLDDPHPLQQVLRDLDTARATVATVLSSPVYGPKLRELIEECLTKEHA